MTAKIPQTIILTYSCAHELWVTICALIHRSSSLWHNSIPQIVMLSIPVDFSVLLNTQTMDLAVYNEAKFTHS